MTVSTFVLLPGAWHSSAFWQRVVPLLQARGHHVITPELLGMGSDPTPTAQVKLIDWVDQIVKIVEEQVKPVVLVGHSRAGIIISAVAERVPEKIKLLIYLTACLLPSGANIKETVAATSGESVVIVNPDGTSVVDPDKALPLFYSKTSSEWTKRVSSLLSAEPPTPFSERLSITDDRYGRVPRAFIECTQDKAMPLSLQRSMQHRLPCKYVVTMNTDHSPFFSAPVELADNLHDLASKV